MASVPETLPSHKAFYAAYPRAVGSLAKVNGHIFFLAEDGRVTDVDDLVAAALVILGCGWAKIANITKEKGKQPSV